VFVNLEQQCSFINWLICVTLAWFNAPIRAVVRLSLQGTTPRENHILVAKNGLTRKRESLGKDLKWKFKV